MNSTDVEYLLVGGYAVGLYGYPRATGDMDRWVAAHRTNVEKLVSVLLRFGFSASSVNADLFATPRQFVRMGVPPIAIDLITSASGVDFFECHRRRRLMDIDGVEASVIHADDLKKNKKARGRSKDLDDLENLPPSTFTF